MICPKKKCRRKVFKNFDLFAPWPLVDDNGLMVMRVPCYPLLTWMPHEWSLNGETKAKFDDKESLSRNDVMWMMEMTMMMWLGWSISKFGDGRYGFYLLYYFNHEFGCFIIFDTKDPFVLISISWKKEYLLWLRWNDDEMDATYGINNSLHATNSISFFVFSSALQDVDTYNEVSVIKIGWIHSKLHRPSRMSWY